MTWLAMALFDLLFPLMPIIIEDPEKRPTSTSRILLKIIGPGPAEKMREAMRKLKAAIEHDSLSGYESDGVGETIAELMELLSGIWLTTGEFKESAESTWLAKYLSEPKENTPYDAWSWADKSESMRMISVEIDLFLIFELSQSGVSTLSF